MENEIWTREKVMSLAAREHGLPDNYPDNDPDFDRVTRALWREGALSVKDRVWRLTDKGRERWLREEGK